MSFKNSIWITWERQRRSIELAKALEVKLFVLLNQSSDIPHRLIRYPYLLTKTLLIIVKEKPRIIFAQNPSIVLVSFLCLLKKILRYKLIVDRHSNFALDTINSKNISWKLFHLLSKYSIRNADITIVTNEFLCNIVNSWHGKGFVLQDKLPDLHLGKIKKLNGEKNIVFITTFVDTEPILELIDAARKIVDNPWLVYMPGNYKNFYKNYRGKEYVLKSLPQNIKITGFLPEKEFQSLLMSADLLVVLTTETYTLTCGAYEGVVLNKPLVVSDTEVIRNYFSKGVVYAKSDGDSIAEAIKYGIENTDLLKKNIKNLEKELKVDWSNRFKNLCDVIEDL